jgi:hypothetical protein
MRPLAPGGIALLLAQLAGAALGQSGSVPPPTPITFPAGSTLTTVTGQVVLGGSDLYYVAAKAGQTMLVSIAAAEGDISFLVYAPDVSIARAADGKAVIRGATLPDAGRDDHAKAWVGVVPRRGNYLIAVTMGEAGPVLGDYSLTVSLQ